MTNVKRVCSFGLAISLMILAGMVEVAHATTDPNAIPDWTGVWVPPDDFLDKQDGTETATTGRFANQEEADLFNKFMEESSMPPYKEKYRKEVQTYNREHNSGRAVNDRGAACRIPGMPMFWRGPYAFEIVQTPTQINLYQEFESQVRRIYINKEHPKDLDPSFAGHSIAHWEFGIPAFHATRLVVDTVGFREDTEMLSAGRHSNQMHITERFTSGGPDMLNVEVIVDDPEVLTEPWVQHLRLRRKPGMEILEYYCEENNRNQVDESGSSGAVLGK